MTRLESLCLHYARVAEVRAGDVERIERRIVITRELSNAHGLKRPERDALRAELMRLQRVHQRLEAAYVEACWGVRRARLASAA